MLICRMPTKSRQLQRSWLLRIAAVLCLPILVAPCYALSDEDVFGQSVVRLVEIEHRGALALTFESTFFGGAFKQENDVYISPLNWTAAKNAQLKGIVGSPQRQYQDKDLQRFLTEFERLQRKYFSELDSYPSTHTQEIRKNLSWWLNEERSTQWKKLLEDPLAGPWWSQNLEFLKEAKRLSGLARLVLQIAPERFLSADLNATSGIPVIDPQKTYYTYLVQKHDELDFLVHSDVLKGVLPADFDLQGLRELDLKIHEQAKQLQFQHYQPMSGLDKAIYTLTAGLTWGAASRNSKSLQADGPEVIPSKLKQLGTRLKLSKDNTAYCEQTRAMFSSTSLAEGRSNWKAIRLADGTNALANENAMRKMVDGFTFGCFTAKRDAKTARQVLAAWAAQHGEEGRLAADTHCKLASWYQYGIGGSKDLQLSAAWDAKAKSQGGIANCKDRTGPIYADPSDPWKVLD